MSNAGLGARGEDAAVAFLVASGIEVVERNWRCRYGELDVVAREGDTTVFVEVKTRSGTMFGSPEESVTVAKQGRIRRLAGLWLIERGGPFVAVRFDVIGVIATPGGQPTVVHHRAVF
ncbi:YraN family protein [Rhodococcoides trifolii]|uniref:YraN family protein n=1 Tax=Rhodococcoides trifolii TaxID=908250 RepID=UPI001667862D|nr:YraN family protein [Rhodococcus trifolii]